jgi:hypothetical protein
MSYSVEQAQGELGKWLSVHDAYMFIAIRALLKATLVTRIGQNMNDFQPCLPVFPQLFPFLSEKFGESH